MKKSWLLVMLLCVCLLFISCSGANPENPSTFSTTAPTEPVIISADIYQDAVDHLSSYPGISIQTQMETKVYVDTHMFEESSEYTLTYGNAGTDAFYAKIAGDVKFANVHTASLKELYHEGAVYGTINNYSYTVPLTQDLFLGRYTPAILLNPDVYSSVDLNDSEITFSGATALEEWIRQDGFKLIDASGTAYLDPQMHFTGFTYSVSYLYGSVRYELFFKTSISPYEGIPEKPNVYTPWIEIPLVDAPMIMERAYGYLLNSGATSILSSQVVQCEAEMVSAALQNALYLLRDEDLRLEERGIVDVLDLTNGDGFAYTTSGTYQDGIYTYFEDEEEIERSELNREDMEYYVDSSIHFPVMMNLDKFFVSFVPGGVVFDYTFDTAVAEGYRQNAQYFLFGEPQYLDLQASGYELLMSEGYLAIDQYSGLPTTVSVTYSATHTIDGEKYPLTMQITQVINAVDRNAYTALNGEPIKEEVPLEQPTPLFYRVSGKNGQEMWMLGTIHVGDARTDNLPTEIYDAFAKADSLAVEFDMNDFADQLANDPELAEKVLKEYLYLDGTNIADHLQTPQLYEAAVQTMKLAGQLQGTILVTKPVIWSQILESYYLRQGYALSAEHGVDMQLLELAQQQDKPILNVESGISQLKMLSGFSDEIQEVFLMATLSIDPASYNEQQMTLYELWCAGDKEKIIEALKTDTTAMSPEELQLYEEYTKAMETDRNAQMLQVAEEYLESGETVFFAVGLAHLLAEDGLIHTLQEAGYTVEEIAYS